MNSLANDYLQAARGGQHEETADRVRRAAAVVPDLDELVYLGNQEIADMRGRISSTPIWCEVNHTARIWAGSPQTGMRPLFSMSPPPPPGETVTLDRRAVSNELRTNPDAQPSRVDIVDPFAGMNPDERRLVQRVVRMLGGCR